MSVLSHRDYRVFFVGNLISSSGSWLQNVAQGVLVLQLTGRSTMVGAVQAAQFVPVLLLALHGGRLADRFDRRRLLVWTQVVAAAATAVLALLAAGGHAGVAAIAVVAVVLGVQYAVSVPAAQALVPSLVPPEELGPAVGLMSVTYNMARAVGPLLSTVAIALLGFGLAFGLNSLSFVALAVAVLAIPSRERGRRRSEGSIREGLRHAWNDHRLRALLLTVTAVSFATDPVFTLSPALAHQSFGRPASDAGLLVSAFGGGAIAAAVFLGRLFRRGTAERRRIGLATLALMVAGLGGMAVAPSIWVGVAALAVGGVGYLLNTTTWTTGIQEHVPDELRGRVMALWTLCFLGSRPVASVLDGVLADALSPRAAALIMLVPVIVAGAVLIPRLGRERGPAGDPGRERGPAGDPGRERGPARGRPPSG